MVRWRVKVETEIVDIGSTTFPLGNEKDAPKVHIVKFDLKGPVSPEAAKDIAELIEAYVARFVKMENKDLLVLTGRGPIWLYMLAQHYLHGSVSNLGIYDPKVGIVIVASHGWDFPYREGDVIKKDKIPDDVVEWVEHAPPAGAR